MAGFTAEEQRAYIKIEFYKGSTGTEIFQTLQSVCGEQALSRAAVFRWFASFKEGRIEVTKKTSPGHPTDARKEENVAKVRSILDSDRRLTCEEIAKEMGISHGSVHTILTQNLNMRRVAARWVPHALTLEQKQSRVDIAQKLLSRYQNEKESFINRIVAIDETWIRSYEPELKRQSSEWHTPSSPRPVKFRRKQGHLKMMMIFAYDNKGILASHRVPTGQTVNQAYYRAFLMNVLRPAIRKKRPELLEVTPLILHDNAACHKAHVVTSLLDTYCWEVLPHPAYSPDMSPPDFDLFPKLKEPLRGVRFDDLESLEVEVASQVRHINFGCLATGVRDLPHRWMSVIRESGCYIEGM